MVQCKCGGAAARVGSRRVVGLMGRHGAGIVPSTASWRMSRRTLARCDRRRKACERLLAQGSAEGNGETTDVAESEVASSSTSTEGFQVDPFTEETVLAFKTALMPPWKSFKTGSVLCMEIGDAVAETASGGTIFSSKDATLPRVTENIRKAAQDPRIVGLYFKISPLSCGYGKLLELRRHIETFRKSGKFTVAYFELAGMKEYLLASACEEVYAPPVSYLQLNGVAIENQFLRGVLEKIGVEPQIERIGKFKSAGDQLIRKDMSEAQRSVSESLVNSIYDMYVQSISKDWGKTGEEVEALLDSGPHTVQDLVEQGWMTSSKYMNEVEDLLKPR